MLDARRNVIPAHALRMTMISSCAITELKVNVGYSINGGKGEHRQ